MKFRVHSSRAALRVVSIAVAGGLVLGLCQCASKKQGSGAQVVVSVKDQKLAVYGARGKREQKYPVSTSKYGVGDRPGTYGTPVGMHEVVAKIGQGVRQGAVFKNRRPTGEVIKPGTPGRDPIVSRIMWLRGMESQNKNAYRRCIYIHGTADEAEIGQAVSYGCIRMKSCDVVDLFNALPIGTRVYITEASLPSTVTPEPEPDVPSAAQQPPLQLNPEPAHSAPAPVKLAENKSSKTRSKVQEPAHSAPAPVKLAENKSSKTRSKAQEPARSTPAPAKLAENRSSQTGQKGPEASGIQRRQLSDGSTVLYSAPTVGEPGLVLRSKRKGTQALND